MRTCKSSGLLSSSSVVCARPCMIYGVVVVQASAASTAIVYDNATTNSGTAVAQVNTTVNASTNQGPQLPHPIECTNGAYVALTGSGAQVIVYYSLM
jgi:hypothetical protein